MSCRRRQMRVWGNPGSTRDSQQLLFLPFVAWRTRQVGARFDDEPSEGNDRSASRQREVLWRQNRASASLSPESTGDSTSTFSTTRDDIQQLWNGYRSYKSSREDLSYVSVESVPATHTSTFFSMYFFPLTILMLKKNTVILLFHVPCFVFYVCFCGRPLRRRRAPTSSSCWLSLGGMTSMTSTSSRLVFLRVVDVVDVVSVVVDVVDVVI